MTVDEFLTWESQQTGRFEFLAGQRVPVKPSTQARSLLITDIVSLLKPALRGTSMRVLTNFRVRCGDDVRYPAVIVDAGQYIPTAREPSQPFAIIDVDRERDWSAIPSIRYLPMSVGDDPHRVLTLLQMRTK
ncbi:hypothetical protein HJB78_16575 [Rhizobium lentis]|nr:hypothetical protein [Rhizobium lentis]